MKNSYAATSGTPTTRDLLIRDYGPAGTYGRAHAPIDLALPEGSPFEILYAFVDDSPGSHSFGNMYAIVSRLFLPPAAIRPKHGVSRCPSERQARLPRATRNADRPPAKHTFPRPCDSHSS